MIEGQQDNVGSQPNLSVNRKKIEDSSNQNLAGLIENEVGVHLIKNGSGIAKPVVQGLYGNRLTILNNGVAQSGQQWGNDHSPEIDPFAADNITIIKGASALEYAGGNLGSIILVEPKRIIREPHLHGQFNYSFESNGRGNNANLRLEKYSPKLAWRINGTLRKYGDRKTSSYYLNNTGLEEANFSVQLEKEWNEKLFVDLYASTFNTKLGVLRGSHIALPEQIEQAFTQSEPNYTEPNFSYGIEAPNQHVSHQFLKLKAKYYQNENSIIEVIIAGQLNDRQEFDIRRSGRSDTPALSLEQYTLNGDLSYATVFGNDWNFKVGSQTVFTDNTNNPTGILPLIPDYISWENGIFATVSKKKNAVQFKSGLRYDYAFQNALTISNTLPKEIIRYENNFQNLSGLLAIELDINEHQTISLSSGVSRRNPEVNELYSNGLHQGVSGIEEGDVNLNSETSLKNTLEYKWLPSPAFSLSALAYHQRFDDFIFLNPQDEIRPTIRGSFPVFRYEQTDAAIYGFDFSSQFTINNAIIGQVKYSYLRGEDITNDIPLIYMPPNSLFGSISYSVHKPFNLSSNVKLDELELEINNRLVFEHKNILAEQDFIAPPAGYNLVGLKVSSNILTPSYKLRLFIKAKLTNMKKAFLLMIMTLSLVSCDPNTLSQILSVPTSQADVASALKQALSIGAEKSSQQLSASGGYYDSIYKILLPEEANTVISKLKFIPGFTNIEEEIIKKINQGAEDAASKAGNIFLGAIKQMTIQDAMGILMGEKDAATNYLHKATYNALYSEFNPVIVNSLNKFGALDYWTKAVNKYNSIPFVDKVNPDLADHVTAKSLVGLFDVVEKKELGIRTDISQRTSQLLKDVFAKQD